MTIDNTRYCISCISWTVESIVLFMRSNSIERFWLQDSLAPFIFWCTWVNPIPHYTRDPPPYDVHYVTSYLACFQNPNYGRLCCCRMVGWIDWVNNWYWISRVDQNCGWIGFVLLNTDDMTYDWHLGYPLRMCNQPYRYPDSSMTPGMWINLAPPQPKRAYYHHLLVCIMYYWYALCMIGNTNLGFRR